MRPMAVSRGTRREGDSRLHREVVQVTAPTAIHAGRDVPRESGINIPVAKHHRARFEQRKDALLGAIGEIGGMNQEKSPA